MAVFLEEKPVKPSGVLEVKLGPVVHALVVEDPGAAAQVIAGRSNPLPWVWLIARDTTSSSGEAIGVGAALMMVIRMEWEPDANLLRGRKSAGSLRFLFLDEANRLSQDNPGVLFTLCQTRDLHFIAAPEVAHAEGNTTYCLVRRTTGDGGEEVVASGRRTRAEA